MTEAQDIIGSDITYQQDYNNTINALMAVDQKTQEENILIYDVNDTTSKGKLSGTLTSNLNGTELNSVGSRVASLLIALNAIEETIDSYENQILSN